MIGTILDMKFRIPEKGGRVIQCLARVVRIQEENPDFLAGVMFLDLSSADRIYLDEFIQKVMGSARKVENA